MDTNERNLLSVAYKNCVGNKRTSWRILDTLEKKHKEGGTEENKQLEFIKNYKTKVEKELDVFCKDIISILDEKMIPNANDS